MTKRLVLVSELAFYPIHWHALLHLRAHFDVEGAAIAAGSADLPSVHRQLGWAEPDPADCIDVRLLPLRPGLRRVRWLRGTLGELQPDAIWLQQEPTDRLALEVLAALPHRHRPRVVCAVCQNIFPPAPLGLRLAEQALWGRFDALAAVATPSIEGIRSAGMPRAIVAEPLVAGALSSPEKVEPLRLPFAAGARFVVGFAGRLVHHKGIDVLIDAVEGLPEDGFALLLAGDGPLRNDVERRLRAGSLAGRSSLLGLLPKDELWRFYASLDALAFPSRTTPSWKEQFGGVLADAMALGVPIVGSDSGAIPEVVGDAGLIVPEGQPEPLRSAIASLAADAAMRERLTKAGRHRFASEFAISAYAAKLARLLQLDLRPALEPEHTATLA